MQKKHQARIKHRLDELGAQGGSFNDVRRSCTKLIEQETGIIEINFLQILNNPKMLYKWHCTTFSVKERMAYELINFYVKYTGKYPVLPQYRDEIPNETFLEFFRCCEHIVIDLCQKNLEIIYSEVTTDHDTVNLLKKILRKKKSDDVAINKVKIPSSHS